MTKKLFLLLLMSVNVCASSLPSPSLRAGDYNIATIFLITGLAAIVAGRDTMIAALRAEYEKAPKDGDVQLSPEEIEAEVTKVDYVVIAAAVGLGVLFLPIIQDIHQYWFPSAEQKWLKMQGDQIGYSSQVQAKFKDCLFGSKLESERGFLNSPKHCEDLAYEFAACGGTHEMIKMIDDFDGLRK